MQQNYHLDHKKGTFLHMPECYLQKYYLQIPYKYTIYMYLQDDQPTPWASTEERKSTEWEDPHLQTIQKLSK